MSSTNIFTCHLCKRRAPVTFQSIDHLEAHFAQHHFQCLPYVCEQCPQFASGIYPTEAAIIQHMKLVHGTESEYEFKIIVREDTGEKRAKVRAAVEQSVRNCAPVTVLSSSSLTTSTTTTSNNDSSGGANEQPQPQQQQGLKRNAPEASGAATGSPVWKIPKKQKKGSDSGAKSKGDGGHHQLSESAAKGGYNDPNIDGLFGEIELLQQQQQNQQPPATDKDTNCNNNRKDVVGPETGDMEQQNNSNAELCSSNSRDGLVRSPLPVSPVKLQISKGIPQQQQPDNNDESQQRFVGNQKSSSLGLVLYKAEKEGREHRARQQLRNGQSSHFSVVTSPDNFRNEFLSSVRQRDHQLDEHRQKKESKTTTTTREEKKKMK